MVRHKFGLLRSLTLMAGLWSSVGETAALKLVSEDDLFRNATLIMQGVVENVEYRSSSATTLDEPVIPHTFVTFKIEHIFKGSTGAEAITLRFQGGPVEGNRVLLVGGIPLFDRGDRDILFVNGNGKRIAPLVGWEQGRFRVIADKVYSHSGEALWLSRTGKLLFGAIKPLPEIVTNTIGDALITFDMNPENSDWTPPKGAVRLTRNRFARYITTKIGQLSEYSTALAPSFEPSVSINQPFSVAPWRAARPPNH